MHAERRRVAREGRERWRRGEWGDVGVKGGGASSSLALARSHPSCALLSGAHDPAQSRAGRTSRNSKDKGRKQFLGLLFCHLFVCVCVFAFVEEIQGRFSQSPSPSRFPELRTQSLSSDRSSGHSGTPPSSPPLSQDCRAARSKEAVAAAADPYESDMDR